MTLPAMKTLNRIFTLPAINKSLQITHRASNYYRNHTFETPSFCPAPRYHSNISSPQPRPILLAYEKFQPHQLVNSPPPESQPPLIILHGLFGSKQNWRSVAKKLSQLSQRTVFTLDLRNHGQSAATPGSTTYLDYAIDVKNFIHSNNLGSVILMGHSMGGKVAMTLALQCSTISPVSGSSQKQQKDDSKLIKKLIVVDIAPAKGSISKRFQTYLEGFKEINSHPVSSRKEADQILSQFETDIGVRQFLLTNLEKVDTTHGLSDEPEDPVKKSEYKIRLPIQVLEEQILSDHIGDFPYEPSLDLKSREKDSNQQITHFQNPSLFIKGAKSKYINKYNLPAISAFFHNSKVVTLNTGHLVHAEKPNEFIETVVGFIEEDL